MGWIGNERDCVYVCVVRVGKEERTHRIWGGHEGVRDVIF